MLICYIPRRTGQAPESSSGQDPDEKSGQGLFFLAIPKHRDQVTIPKSREQKTIPKHRDQFGKYDPDGSGRNCINTFRNYFNGF